MNLTSILETMIGSFFGAFFAFVSGICVERWNVRYNKKQELKRYFGLLSSNQGAIDEMGRLFSQGVAQKNLNVHIVTIRNSSDSKHKLHDIKEQGIRLTLEIYEYCKDVELRECVLQQIDFQDRVHTMLCGLYSLSEDELNEKLVKSEKEIDNIIADMKNNHKNWIMIENKLKKLKLL